jgi:pimeloyl-ACP methyl ester carboxylesterase
VIRQDVSEAFCTGVWGWVDDDLCLVGPWGFDVGEIRIPTRVTYGLTDVLVPALHGQWLARHVPGAEEVAEERLGHLSHPDLVAERFEWLVRPV